MLLRYCPAILIASSVLLAGGSSALADEFDDCLNRKKQELQKSDTFVGEGGCETKKTNCITGERDSCNGTVCYQAPKKHIIAGQVAVRSLSATGTEHSYTAVTYHSNSHGENERACVNVHARSQDGHCAGRGWQTVQLTGEIRRVIDEDTLSEAAKACAKEVYGN